MVTYEWDEAMCRKYADGIRAFVKFDHRQWATRIAAELKDLPPGSKIVDVATGPGFLLREIGKALSGHTLIAQDQAKPMLTIASEEAQAEGVTLQTVHCPAEHISLPSGDVDVVTCKQFLHEAGDVDTALAEMHRILRPGGRLFLIDFDRNGSGFAAIALRLLMTIMRGRELGNNFWKSYRGGLAGEDVRQRLIKLRLANVEYQCVGCNYLVMGTKL